MARNMIRYSKIVFLALLIVAVAYIFPITSNFAYAVYADTNDGYPYIAGVGFWGGNTTWLIDHPLVPCPLCLFVVETVAPGNISGGNVTFNANILCTPPTTTCTKIGFEYGKSLATMTEWSQSGNFSTVSSFSLDMIGLDEGSIYYVRALIGNTTDTRYGEYIGFLTLGIEIQSKAYWDLTVTGNCSVDYDYLPLVTTTISHLDLIAAGWINGNATDTQLTILNDGLLPYTPVSDRLAFLMTDFKSKEKETLRYYLGTNDLQTSFYTIVGYEGNITRAESLVMRPGNTFEFDVKGIFDMATGNTSKVIFYKQDAVRLYISGTGNLTATIGPDGAAAVTITASGIPSGIHRVQVIGDAGNNTFSIYVDSILISEVTPTASVPINGNEWVFMGNNSLVAAEYIKESVGGDLKLWYQPTVYINGTILPDRTSGLDGTINWGTNPVCVSVIPYGGIMSNSFLPPAGWGNGTNWAVPRTDLTGWFGGCGNVSAQPFYATFLSAANDMGMPVCSLYLMMMLGVATAIGLGTLVFTGSIMISVIATALTIMAAANTSVVPFWLAFTFAVLAISMIYLSRQT